MSKATSNDILDSIRATGTSEGSTKGWEGRGHGGFITLTDKRLLEIRREQSDPENMFKFRVGNADEIEGHSKEIAFKSHGHNQLISHLQQRGYRVHQRDHEKLKEFFEGSKAPEESSWDKHYRQATEHMRSNSPMSTNKSNTIRCRATSGVQLHISQPWQQGVGVSFVYAPAGIHTIQAGFRDGSITMTLKVDAATPKRLQESFDHLTATKPKQEPYADEDHEARKATLRFGKDKVKFSWGKVNEDEGVVVTGCEPTSYGADAANGKVYRSWSPEFETNAEYHACKCSECSKPVKTCKCDSPSLVFPDGVRGSASNPAEMIGVNFVAGAMTNRPAFHQMPAIKAKETGATTETFQAVTPPATETETATEQTEQDTVKAGAPMGNKNAEGPHDRYGIWTPESASEMFQRVQQLGGAENAHLSEAAQMFHHSQLTEDHRDAQYLPLMFNASEELNPHKVMLNQERKGGYQWMDRKTWDWAKEKVKPIGEHYEKQRAGKPASVQSATSSHDDAETVKATWSDAAREASAEARRSHAEAESHKAIGLSATAIASPQQGERYAALHDKAASAHHATAKLHEDAGNPKAHKWHIAQAKEHERMASEERALKHIRSSDVPSASDTILAAIAARRSTACKSAVASKRLGMGVSEAPSESSRSAATVLATLKPRRIIIEESIGHATKVQVPITTDTILARLSRTAARRIN